MRKYGALALLFAVAGCSSTSAISQTGATAGGYAPAVAPMHTSVNTQFYTSGRQLMMSAQAEGAAPMRVHGAPVYLKGVDYAPTPICDSAIDNPLGNKERDIWSRDLPVLRAEGVNAIKVYNANPNLAATDPIGDFLNAAYNGGNKPIYVILSIFFPGTAMLNKDAVNDLAGQYQKLAQINGVYPAVIGMSIGSEVNDENLRSNPTFWKGMTALANAARAGFKAAGATKIITTTLVDDGFITEREGEKNNFPVDAWGVNFYRGSTFGVAFSDYKKVSSKPLIVSEWGMPESYHPKGDPNTATEWPSDKIDVLTDYVTGLANELYNNSTVKGGVANGGFYFEYSDEWWKANRGQPCQHLPNPNAPNAKFPGGFDDEGWFGLSSIAAGTPNVLTQRPAFGALSKVWANQ